MLDCNPQRKSNMRRTLCCRFMVGLVVITTWCLAAFAQNSPSSTPCKSTVTGDVEFLQLTSKVFDNTRTIRVLLPPGYRETANKDRHYKVLYMNDGQNLFDACLSPWSHHEWEADETADRLINEKAIEPLIIVGIDNPGAQRAHEYLPYKDNLYNADMPEPAGKLYPDFLVHEVMPLINAKYRTLTGRANTALGGSSYGAVAALWGVFARPDQFGAAIIESPTLHIWNGQLIRDTAPFVLPPEKIFIAIGGKEGSDPAFNAKLIALVRILQKNLQDAGLGQDRLLVVVDPEAQHTESAWAQRFPAALKLLYGTDRK